MDEAERRLGYAFPPILRRLYIEVANGGFGPSTRGFASVRDGNLLPGGYARETCAQVVQDYRAAGAGCELHAVDGVRRKAFQGHVELELG